MAAGMKLYWSFNSLPELSHLGPEARQTLLRRHVGWNRWIDMLIPPAFIGLLCALAVSSLMDGFPRSIMSLLVFAGLALVIATAVYQFSMLRIRAALRLQIMRELRGQQLPSCLKCSYDLAGIEASRCPECGSPVKVPKR